MDYKKLAINTAIAGTIACLVAAKLSFNLGYKEGQRNQREQDMFEIKSYAGAFIEKCRYWRLSNKELKEFSIFSEDVYLLKGAMEDTSEYMHTIEDRLIERANSK